MEERKQDSKQREQANDLGQSQRACLKHHWSISRVALLIFFALNLAPASACTRGAGVDPVGNAVGTSGTSSLPPTWTSTTLPEASATPQPTAEPTSTVVPTESVTPTTTPTTPSTEADSIAIAMSLILSHSDGDNYYFHVEVRDKEVGFVPETIEVIDPVTNQVVAGPFMLVDQDSLLCRSRLYETDGIDPSQMPLDFWYRHTQVPFFIYRVTVREPTGERRFIDIVEPPFICESEERP